MYTIKDNIKNELIIKNSRFITLLYKIKDKEEVDNLLQEAKITYPKANHYCYAYKIGTNIKKASDDKEPSGTAGLPMLNVLEKEDITNILAITIRYFGGIKLGAGGLVRAYSKSVKEALRKIEIIKLVPGIICNITIPYQLEKEMIKEIGEQNIISKTYLEQITYQARLKETSPLLEKDYVTKLEKTYIEKS